MRKFSAVASAHYYDQTLDVGTYYIPIPTEEILAFTVVGDGTGTATFTVQWCDFALDLSGAAIDPSVAGDARIFQPDAAIGSLSIAASSTSTGGKRVSLSNVPRRAGRIVLAVGVRGRFVINWSGIS
jgi:hypothetical protein